MTAVVKLLRDLVALPSVNPAFTRPDDPHAGESRVGDFLFHTAKRLGLDVERQTVLPGRANILVRYSPSQKPRRRVLLAPHLDTVSLHNERQIHPTLRKGRLYGRGSCDTKASVAAMFTALRAVSQKSTRPSKTEILFAGLIDEENAQSGSRALVSSRTKADLAIVGEPTLLRVVTAHKGDLWLRMVTRGVAAHSSQPWLGKNAIHEMARVVDTIQQDYASRLSKRVHPLLGCATVNVGTIQGGKQPNIVPDVCEIRVDRRTLPGETDAAVIREITALLRSKKCRVELSDWKGLPSVAMETPPSHPYVQKLLQVVGQTQAVGAHYFSDAGVLAQGGIPSVLFGPGDIAQAHTIDEWVSVDQLERATELLTEYLSGLE